MYVFDYKKTEYGVILTFDGHLDDVNPRWPPKYIIKHANVQNFCATYSRFAILVSMCMFLITSKQNMGLF